MPLGHIQTITFHPGADGFDVVGHLFGYKRNAMVNVQVFLTQGTATASGSVYAKVEGTGQFTAAAHVTSVDAFDVEMPVMATALATEIWTSTLTPEAPAKPAEGIEAALPVHLWHSRREDWSESNVRPEAQQPDGAAASAGPG